MLIKRGPICWRLKNPSIFKFMAVTFLWIINKNIVNLYFLNTKDIFCVNFWVKLDILEARVRYFTKEQTSKTSSLFGKKVRVLFFVLLSFCCQIPPVGCFFFHWISLVKILCFVRFSRNLVARLPHLEMSSLASQSSQSKALLKGEANSAGARIELTIDMTAELCAVEFLLLVHYSFGQVVQYLSRRRRRGETFTYSRNATCWLHLYPKKSALYEESKQSFRNRDRNKKEF